MTFPFPWWARLAIGRAWMLCGGGCQNNGTETIEWFGDALDARGFQDAIRIPDPLIALVFDGGLTLNQLITEAVHDGYTLLVNGAVQAGELLDKLGDGIVHYFNRPGDAFQNSAGQTTRRMRNSRSSRRVRSTCWFRLSMGSLEVPLLVRWMTSWRSWSPPALKARSGPVFPGGALPFLGDYTDLLTSLFNRSKTDPIVLDLGGTGIELTSLAQSDAQFDLLGNGFAVRTGCRSGLRPDCSRATSTAMA